MTICIRKVYFRLSYAPVKANLMCYMNICLQTHAKQSKPTHFRVNLDTGLPPWIQSPCEMVCTFEITASQGYYLLDLTMDAVLLITCQRCLGLVEHIYHHQTKLAVCPNDERAERLMECFDCVISKDDQLNLYDVLIGELYLNSPERPHELDNCHVEMAV